MSSTPTPIKIAITDDHPMVRDGLQTMLSTYAQFQIIGSFEKGAYLLQGLKVEQPDILLLDLQLPDIGGEELAPKLHALYPDMRIIILTANNSSYSIKRLLNAGVRGYVLKNLDQALLVKAITEVYEGGTFVSPELQEKLLKLSKAADGPTNMSDLTPREVDILKLIAEELTTQEIAQRLFLSSKTVENYRMVLMQKLGCRNMVGMTKKAIMLGLID